MKVALKKIYVKLFIVLGVFILVLTFYLLSFKFYQKNLIKKVEKINNIKTTEANNRSNINFFNKQKQIINTFNQKSGKNLDNLLTSVEAKINKNSYQIIQLFKEKGWQFNETKNIDLNSLKIDLTIKPEELNNFLNFLIEETIFLKIKNIKIIKSGDNYQINLEFLLNQ